MNSRNEYQDLSYVDDATSSRKMTMSYPQVSLPSEFIGEGFDNNFMPNVNFDYPLETPLHFHQSPRNINSPPGSKVKTETIFTQHTLAHSDQEPRTLSFSGQPTPIGEPLPLIPPPLQNNPPKGRIRGKGRGRVTDDQDPAISSKAGKGKATTQGVVVPITHQGRDVALAEQARRRKRVDGDEPQDDSQDRMLQDFLTEGNTDKVASVKRRKTEGRVKREHHACDRCFRNKTKVESTLRILFMISAIAILMANRPASIFHATIVLVSTGSAHQLWPMP